MKKLNVEFIVPEYVNIENLVETLQHGSEGQRYVGNVGYCKLRVEAAFGERSVSVVMVETPIEIESEPIAKVGDYR